MTYCPADWPGVDAAGASDRGLVRPRNEDAFFCRDELKTYATRVQSCGAYVVADGIGGHAGGEIASRRAVDSVSHYLLRYIRGSFEATPVDALRQAVILAHRKILHLARRTPGLGPMGTTIVAALRLDYDLFIAHLGDSRAYLVRDGRVRQLTEDHSVLADLIRRGLVTTEDARAHPDKGKIFRCLGIASAVEPDMSIRGASRPMLRLGPGDGLLLCTDGLTDVTSEANILQAFTRERTPDLRARWLVEFANSRGGFDNVTALVANLDRPDDPAGRQMAVRADPGRGTRAGIPEEKEPVASCAKED